MNLVLGAVGGYSFAQLAPFVRSLRKVSRVACVFLDYGLEPEVVTDLARHEVQVAPVEDPAPLREITHDRFRAYAAFLSAHGHRFDRVLFTDVRDVVFQGDPFALDTGPGLAAFAESGTIGADPCNAGWIRDVYGPAMLERLREKPILCAGTTLGSVEAALAYTIRMARELRERKGSGLWGRDQGMHNALLWTGELEARLLRNGAGVYTLALVTPETIRFDRDGQVVVEGCVPAVLHQYDRHPVLAALLAARFGV